MNDFDLHISLIFELLLITILIVKMLFILSIVLKLQAIHIHDDTQIKRYDDYQTICHKGFTFLMGILLIIVFDPRKYPIKVCVSGHTKVYIYLFGLLSIIGVLHDYYNTRVLHNKKKVI